MKKVLIISEMFFPSNAVGAVRPTKISKYLTKLGYEVDVVTKNSVDKQNQNVFFHKIYAWDGNVSSFETPMVTSQHTTPQKHSWIYRKLYSIFYLMKNILNARATVSRLKRLLNGELGENKYDVVISSFGPLSSLLCGLYYKKSHPEVKWICDFRDPVVVDVVSKIFHPYYRYLQNKACKKADVITTVSKGYFDRICGKKYASKAFMIPNGYDREDATAFNEHRKNEKLTFAYAGILYSGKRDISPLFAAIRELIDEGVVSPEKICVEYAGRDFMYLDEQAQKYCLRDVLCNHGQMNRKECLEFQHNSDILLLATWNDKNEIGVFPGKFLEYMLMNKPIVALVSGDIPDSEVKVVMDEGNFGVVYEEASDRVDFENLKNYIKREYNEWSVSKKISFEPKKEVLERYNYRTIIRQIEDLING